MAIKTYVLTEAMDANAPVYQKLPDGQRTQIKKIPVHAPTLRQEFYDENGNHIVIRYKANSKFIYQDKQIEEEKIPANEPFSETERQDRKFRFGTLTTGKLKLQEYLEAHPEFEGFTGQCDTVREPRYRLINLEKDAKVKNEGTRLMLKAVNKIMGLKLEEAQAMLIRLNGSFFETPKDLEECQNLLVDFVNDAEAEAAITAVLKEEAETTVDEKTTVLLGSLVNAGLLSFSEIEGSVTKKSNGKWIVVREFSTEYSLSEMERLFNNFLNTDDGKALKKDLEADLKNIAKKKIE